MYSPVLDFPNEWLYLRSNSKKLELREENARYSNDVKFFKEAYV